MTVTHELLRKSPLFMGLTEEDLERLYQMSATKFIPAGAQLIQEGTLGYATYIVLEGELEVTKRSGTDQVVLARLGPGELVGEMALMEQSVRTASVRALRDS